MSLEFRDTPKVMSSSKPTPSAPLSDGENVVADGETLRSEELETPLLAAPVVQVMVVTDAQLAEEEDQQQTQANAYNPPMRRWKDGLCSCFSQGCCHPSLCCALFFPSIAIAQVMKRLNLSLLGSSVSKARATCTFNTILCMTVLFYIFNSSHVTGFPFHEIRNIVSILVYGIPSLFVLYILFLIMRTRCAIRKKYRISNSACCCGACGGCGCVEDVACTLLFPTLVISQMARHTADFDTYRASCCSQTGLPDGAPEIV